MGFWWTARHGSAELVRTWRLKRPGDCRPDMQWWCRVLHPLSISKFGKELQALRITIITTISPIWEENYDMLLFFINDV